MSLNTVRDLLSNDDLAAIWDAPPMATGRHPTWYPVFFSAPRAVDHLSNQAVRHIASRGGEAWLRGLRPRLNRIGDPEEAAAALAELRAYGGLVEAGFKVTPIPTADDSTPDFDVDAGDGQIVIEVFAKHQDTEEARLWADIGAGQTPPGVERYKIQGHRARIEMTVSESRPGGAPDPSKPNDSAQANVISRVCAAKGREAQFPADRPSLLWIDLRSFGSWPEAVGLEQCAPLVSGRDGLTSGALWYAFYGWRGAPVFEEDFFPQDRVVSMGHDGRFRLDGAKKSKLSGVVLALTEGLVFLENPWAINPLPARARRFVERLPGFDLHHSICDWSSGDAETLVAVGKNQIEAMMRWRTLLSPP